MGCVSSKSTSVGHILENLVYTRGATTCSFGPIFLKAGQNVCFDDISLMIDHWSDEVKK